MWHWTRLLPAVLLFAAAEASSSDAVFNERLRPAVVAFETSREIRRASAGLRRRQSTNGVVGVEVDNQLVSESPNAIYTANLSIGNPVQTVMVQLDTGSNDLVLNTPDSGICQEGYSCQGLTYSANSSSTYQYLSSNASLGYGGGDQISGDYATDTLHFNGVTVKDVQMILAYDTTTINSIWGISYGAGEQGIGLGEPQYPTVTELMISSGAIKSNTFSLWLNSQDSPTGSLLFGGVNQGKYHGPLSTIPIELNPDFTYPTEFIVTVTGIGLTLSASSSKTGKAVSIPIITNRADPYLIDSGTYNIQLPIDILRPIINNLGGEYEKASQFAMVPCSMTTNTSTIDFTFTSFSISIPLTELIFPADTLAYDGYAPVLSDGKTPACLLGMSTGGEDFVLGDTFMRSAYIVFDLDNNEISLAQANIGANDTQPDNIVEIPAGTNPIPGATRVLNPVRAWANETAIANDDIPATGTWEYYAPASMTVTATSIPHLVATTQAGSISVHTTVTATGKTLTAAAPSGTVKTSGGTAVSALSGLWAGPAVIVGTVLFSYRLL